MRKYKIFMAVAAVALSFLFAAPQIMNVNTAKAEDEAPAEESVSDVEESVTPEEEDETSLPRFAVVDGNIYAVPGTTVVDILAGVEGAVRIKEAEPESEAQPEAEELESEEKAEEESEAESKDLSETENEASEEEPKEAPALLAGTGMIVIMEDETELVIVIKGDVDGDGVVSANDARSALRFAVRLDIPTSEQENASLVKDYITADAEKEAEEANDEEDAPDSAEEKSSDAEEEEPSSEEDLSEEAEQPEIPDTATAVTAADARAILRAAVKLENANDWFGAVTAGDDNAEEEGSSEEDISSEEESSSDEEAEAE